jgi:hypothetical protein
MVRQDADCDRFKRETLLGHFVSAPKPFNMAHEQITRTIGKCQREEK